jgi:trimeric autotransporter adhesin
MSSFRYRIRLPRQRSTPIWLLSKTGGGNVFNVTVSESVSLADTLTSQVAFNPTISEALALADTVSSGTTTNNSISEAISLADTVTVSLAFNPAISEALALSEVGTITGSAGLQGLLSEALALADTLTVVGTTTVTVSEALALADTVAMNAQSFVVTVGETMQLLDSLQGSGGTGVAGVMFNEFRTSTTLKIGAT